eukprot:1148435-Pelagomonas_calceolata.AAC.4
MQQTGKQAHLIKVIAPYPKASSHLHPPIGSPPLPHPSLSPFTLTGSPAVSWGKGSSGGWWAPELLPPPAAPLLLLLPPLGPAPDERLMMRTGMLAARSWAARGVLQEKQAGASSKE